VNAAAIETREAGSSERIGRCATHEIVSPIHVPCTDNRRMDRRTVQIFALPSSVADLNLFQFILDQTRSYLRNFYHRNCAYDDSAWSADADGRLSRAREGNNTTAVASFVVSRVATTIYLPSN